MNKHVAALQRASCLRDRLTKRMTAAIYANDDERCYRLQAIRDMLDRVARPHFKALKPLKVRAKLSCASSRFGGTAWADVTLQLTHSSDGYHPYYAEWVFPEGEYINLDDIRKTDHQRIEKAIQIPWGIRTYLFESEDNNG